MEGETILRFPQFSITDQTAWKAFTDMTNNAHKLNIAIFAQLWAENIEKGVREGKQLKDVVEAAFNDASQSTKVKKDEIPIMVNTLAKVWAHGPELLQWYKSRGE